MGTVIEPASVKKIEGSRGRHQHPASTPGCTYVQTYTCEEAQILIYAR